MRALEGGSGGEAPLPPEARPSLDQIEYTAELGMHGRLGLCQILEWRSSTFIHLLLPVLVAAVLIAWLSNQALLDTKSMPQTLVLHLMIIGDGKPHPLAIFHALLDGETSCDVDIAISTTLM